MYEVVPEESLTPAEPPAETDQPIVTLDEAMKRHIERALVATRAESRAEWGRKVTRHQSAYPASPDAEARNPLVTVSLNE